MLRRNEHDNSCKKKKMKSNNMRTGREEEHADVKYDTVSYKSARKTRAKPGTGCIHVRTAFASWFLPSRHVAVAAIVHS